MNLNIRKSIALMKIGFKVSVAYRFHTVVTLIMTLYFGRHRDEELGWNTAFGNSLTLLFVSIDLFRYIYHLTIPATFYNYIIHLKGSIISGVVFIEALLLLYAKNFLMQNFF